MTLALALLALSLGVPEPAPPPGEGDVRVHVALHARFTDRENQPRPPLLVDSGKRAFDLGPYLRPQGSDEYLSTFASLGVEGHHGMLRWALSADTGELRRTSFSQLAPVCASSLSPTGLDVGGSGRCNLLGAGRATVLVEETRLAAARLTSNGRPFEDELRSTLFVREAWAGVTLGRNDFVSLKAGRKRFTVADGFVFDDYGTGAEASFDLGALGPSWDLGVALLFPTRDFPTASNVRSPMLALRADWLPSLFEHVGGFLAFYRDRSNSVAELFRGSFAEPGVLRLRELAPGTQPYVLEERALATVVGSDRESEAGLGWLGASASVRALGGRLDCTGAVAFGNVTLRLPNASTESHSSVSGRLGHVALRRRITSGLELRGSLLYLSGDLPPDKKKRLGLPEGYGGFLGVSPYVTETNLFFSGGVAESFAARQATAPGVNGRGVIAPVLAAFWEAARTVGVEARAAHLVAPEVGPFGGRTYGTELDVELSWALLPWLTVLGEADVLFTGDFFAGRAPVTKFVLGIDLLGG